MAYVDACPRGARSAGRFYLDAAFRQGRRREPASGQNPSRQAKLAYASFRILGACTLDGVLNQDNELSANGGQETLPGLFVVGRRAQHFLFAKLLGNAKSGVAFKIEFAIMHP